MSLVAFCNAITPISAIYQITDMGAPPLHWHTHFVGKKKVFVVASPRFVVLELGTSHF